MTDAPNGSKVPPMQPRENVIASASTVSGQLDAISLQRQRIRRRLIELREERNRREGDPSSDGRRKRMDGIAEMIIDEMLKLR